MNEKKEILDRLKNGLDKRTIYHEFQDKMDDAHLRRILASRPSNNTATKFRILHKILSWIWVLFVLSELLGIVNLVINFDVKIFISLVISTYIMIQVWKFNGDVFLPGMIWLVWAVFNSIKELRYLTPPEPDYDFLMTFSIGYIFFISIAILLMYIVRKHVFDYYNWFKPDTDNHDDIVFESYNKLYN